MEDRRMEDRRLEDRRMEDRRIEDRRMEDRRMEDRRTSGSPELYKKYLSCLCAVTISCIVITVTLLIHILRSESLPPAPRHLIGDSCVQIPRGAELRGAVEVGEGCEGERGC